MIASAERPPSGVVVNKANFDHDLNELADQGGPDFYPPEQRRTIQYTDALRFVRDCGLLTSLVSTLIVRRDRWLRALSELGGEGFATTTIFPHLPIIARMARHDPSWVWCPAKLVRVRMDNAFLASDEGWSVDQIHTRLLGDMSRMWARHLGRANPVRLSLLRRAFATFAAADVLRATAPPAGRSLRDRLALARAYVALFWWVPELWLRTMPYLLLGEREVPGRRRASLPLVRGPLPPGERVARIRASGVPREAPNSSEIRIRLNLRNVGSMTFSRLPPHRVVIGYRWYASDGAVALQGPPLALATALAPGHEAREEVSVLTPHEPGVYKLQIALAQEDVGWFDDRDPELACWSRVDVRGYGWTGSPAVVRG